jgi:hypothetical protein
MPAHYSPKHARKEILAVPPRVKDVTTGLFLFRGEKEIGTIGSPPQGKVEAAAEKYEKWAEARHDLNKNMEIKPYYPFHKGSRDL